MKADYKLYIGSRSAFEPIGLNIPSRFLVPSDVALVIGQCVADETCEIVKVLETSSKMSKTLSPVRNAV